jgi:iron-sulfur cluster assembly protein
MAITVTESAAKHIHSQIAKSGGVGLRLGVKKSGCSGFAYTFDIAQEVLKSDIVFEGYGAKILVDAESLPFLEELEYAKQGLGHVFKFNNPNVKNQCGCGESFAV